MRRNAPYTDLFVQFDSVTAAHSRTLGCSTTVHQPWCVVHHRVSSARDHFRSRCNLFRPFPSFFRIESLLSSRCRETIILHLLSWHPTRLPPLPYPRFSVNSFSLLRSSLNAHPRQEMLSDGTISLDLTSDMGGFPSAFHDERLVLTSKQSLGRAPCK